MPKLFSQTNRRITFVLLLLLSLTFFIALHFNLQNANVANPGAAAGMMENEEDEAATIEHYFQWRFDQMKDKSGTIPDGALIKALNNRAAMVAEQANRITPMDAGISNAGWTFAGPGNVGGRIRAVLPINSSTVFVAGVSGGLWKTTNCCSTGTTWTPIDDWMANIGISSLIVDPTNANVMYAGTGESTGSGFRGAGIFKSTDGGTTWAQLSNTNTSDFYYVNRLAISPNGNSILAATGTGIWHSTDGGATWAQRVNGNWRDIRFDPTNSNNAVAGGSGYAWYTTGGGTSGWAPATFTPAISGRVELAYAPSNPSIVYASVNRNSGEVYKSTDGGHTYTLVNTGQQLLSAQGDYDNAIWVKPDDPNFVVVAGVNMFKSTDGGATFTKIAEWSKTWSLTNEDPSPHADHHALVSIPGSNLGLLNGNDGGMYYTADITTAGGGTNYNSGWVYMNNNLGITQFFGVAGNNNGVLYGGSQDNGVARGTSAAPNAWVFANGGDGGKSAADPTDPNYLYNEYIYGKVNRFNVSKGRAEDIYGSYWNGTTWTCRAAPYRIGDACNGNGVGNFIAPILLDPNDANRLFVGGRSLWVSNDVKTPYVYDSPTGGPQWAVFKAEIEISTNSYEVINAIAIAPGDSNIVWVGYESSRIDVSTNGGTTWTRVDTNIGTGNPGTQVSSIAIDKNDSNIVYVGFTGFSGTGYYNVWRTTNGGASWTQITNNLPNAPVYAVAINPLNSAWLYVGTEIGVFASENTGTTWNVPTGTGKNGDGPANVAVEDLQWMGGGNSTGSTILIAGTHGRSAWTAETLPQTNANTYADDDLLCGGNSPCYATIGDALANVAGNGTVTIYAGAYAENVKSALKTITVNVAGNITVNNLLVYNGSTWNAGSYAITVDDFNLFGGTWNAGSSTLTVNRDWASGGTFNYGTGTVIFAKNGTVTLGDPAQAESTATFCNLAISANTTIDVTDDFIGVSTGAGCGTFTQNGKLRREAPTQYIYTSGSSFTFKDARNRDALVLGNRTGGAGSLDNTDVTITSNSQPSSTTCGSPGVQLVLRQYIITGKVTGGIYPTRLYFSAASPNEANGNTVAAPYNLAIYHCNSSTSLWEKFAGTGGSDANGVYVEASVTFNPGSTFAIGPAGTTYYSQGNLDAGLNTSWNTVRGGGGSAPADFTGSDIFVIQNGHSMNTATALTLSNAGSLLRIESGGALTADANNVSIMGAQVDAGGTLTVNSGRTFTLNNGSRTTDLTVNGTVVNAGTVTRVGTISFGAGSVYQHNTNGGTIPTATWDSTSTVLVTGVTTSSLGGVGQTFGNFTWNSTAQTAGVYGAPNAAINGDLTITSTGTGSVYMTSTSPTVNIGGNLIINGGTLYFSWSGSPTVNVNGNVIFNGGIFRPAVSTGTPILNVTGDWTHNSGTFTHGTSTVNFTKNGVATVSSSAAAGTLLAFNNLSISANTTVDVTDDYINATGSYVQNGKLRREAPAQSLSGTSLFTFKDGRNRDTVTLQKLGGNDLGSTSITITSNQAPTCGTSTLTTPALRQFEITPTGTGPFSQMLQLYFSPANPNESNGLTAANLAVYHCNGSGWESYDGTSGTDPTTGYIYVSAPVDSFSTFAIGPQVATAITLEGIAAVQSSTGVTVTWQTGTEIDNAGFNLYRATDAAGPYTKINASLIPAKGEATSGAGYSYFDTAANEANTVYYYKLEDINLNGAGTFHGPANTGSDVTVDPDFDHHLYLPLILR